MGDAGTAPGNSVLVYSACLVTRGVGEQGQWPRGFSRRTWVTLPPPPCLPAGARLANSRLMHGLPSRPEGLHHVASPAPNRKRPCHDPAGSFPETAEYRIMDRDKRTSVRTTELRAEACPEPVSSRGTTALTTYYLGREEDHVGQAFQPQYFPNERLR